jgi:hypothetical protein
MDSTTRSAAAARDDGVARIGKVTRRIGTAAVAGAFLAVAGFAHLIPTHLPHLGLSGDTNGTSTDTGNGGGSGGTSNNGNIQGPAVAPGNGNGSGGSHVRSGGS